MSFLKGLFGQKQEDDYSRANAHLVALGCSPLMRPSTGGELEMLLPILDAYADNSPARKRAFEALPMNKRVALLRSIAEHGLSIEKRVGAEQMELWRSRRKSTPVAKKSSAEVEAHLIVHGTGNTRGENAEADRRAIIQALQMMDDRHAGKIESQNVSLQFQLCPDEPNDFLLDITVTATGEQSIAMQQDLVAALARAGLKV